MPSSPSSGFQSTHPARGATNVIIEQEQGLLTFQSTHPARGATGAVTHRMGVAEISIHAPREGCDAARWTASGPAGDFNPRTPRGVRRPAAWFKIGTGPFQSTHPARGATAYYGCFYCQRKFQSTHPARGATIGIPAGHNPLLYFNPRTPRGVRRYLTATLDAQTSISIHAPREGCDPQRLPDSHC